MGIKLINIHEVNVHNLNVKHGTTLTFYLGKKCQIFDLQVCGGELSKKLG